MKIYLHKNGILMVGKAWEIKQQLHVYSQRYHTVSDWVMNETIKSHCKNILYLPQNNK